MEETPMYVVMIRKRTFDGSRPVWEPSPDAPGPLEAVPAARAVHREWNRCREARRVLVAGVTPPRSRGEVVPMPVRPDR